MTFVSFMSGWGWVIFSLIATVFGAGIFLVNQYLKQPGHLLVFWSRVVTVLVLTPVMLQVVWPVRPQFYLVVFITALLGAFSDIRTFNVAARYGGGVVSRVQPLIILMSFFLWFAFDHNLLQRYLAHPVNAGFIMLALAGCIYYSSKMGKCHISRRAFFEMLPALLGYTITTVLNKYALQQGPLTGAVYTYMYMQSGFAVPMIGAYVLWRERGRQAAVIPWRTKTMALAAAALSLAWVYSMTLKSYAMAFIPNPSYQVAIGQLTPVFIALFYWKVKHKEEADVASGMGVVAFTILLVCLTAG